MVNALKNKNKQSHKGYFRKNGSSKSDKKFFTFEIISDESIQYSESLSNLRGISYGFAIRSNYAFKYEVLDEIEFSGKIYTIQGFTEKLQDINLATNKLVKKEYNKSKY
jgi:hypothetical protein